MGQADTVSNGVLGTLTMTKVNNSNCVETIDFSPVAVSSFTLQIYNGTNLVTEIPGQTNGTLCSLTSSKTNGDVDIPWKLDASFNPRRKPKIKLGISRPESDSIALSDGSVYTGDSLILTGEQTNLITRASAVLFQSSHLPSISITNEVVSPLTMSASLSSGTGLSLRWSGIGTLEQSSDLASWTNMPGITSPYTVPITAQKGFYRVSQPPGPPDFGF